MFSILMDLMRAINADMERPEMSDSVNISSRYPELSLQPFSDKVVRGKLIGRLKTAMGINQEGARRERSLHPNTRSLSLSLFITHLLSPTLRSHLRFSPSPSHSPPSPLLTPGADDFPGSMPVSFHRRNFAQVSANDYYVSEKTDGVRFLLFVAPEGAFLIDRKLAFARIGASRALQKLYSENGQDSIIDGELVRV